MTLIRVGWTGLILTFTSCVTPEGRGHPFPPPHLRINPSIRALLPIQLFFLFFVVSVCGRWRGEEGGEGTVRKVGWEGREDRG